MVQIDSIELHTLSVSIFYSLWQHAREQIDYIGLPTLNVSIMFYTLWRHARLQIDSTWAFLMCFTRIRAMRGSSLTPLDCPHWTFRLFVHALETCQHTVWLHWIVHIECFYCVLHALEACQGTDWLHWVAHIERWYCLSHTLAEWQGTDWLHCIAHIIRF